MPTRIYSSPEFIRSLLCYRRSQPSVKPMNATNMTMVTSTIMTSSIQILLMGYGIPRTLGFFLIFQFGDGVAISTLSSLCCQSQQSIHRKWFGQADVQQDKIKRVGSQLSQRGVILSCWTSACPNHFRWM